MMWLFTLQSYVHFDFEFVSDSDSGFAKWIHVQIQFDPENARDPCNEIQFPLLEPYA